jgi:hypothetical protein
MTLARKYGRGRPYTLRPAGLGLYEPLTDKSVDYRAFRLRALWRKSVFLASAPHQKPTKNTTKMPTTPPPFNFDHKKGYEIETEYKNTIRELYGFGGKLTE